MARPKPIGFDNYRTFSFVSNDGSGFTFFRKASFSVESGSMHRLYAGPSLASVGAGADTIITANEPHGLHLGQTVQLHGMPDSLATLLNGSHVIFAVTATTFKISPDTSNAESSIAAVDLVAGTVYTVVTPGTPSLGAAGSVFIATGSETGTGTGLAGLSALGVGIAGIDIEARIPVANYAIVPGELVSGDHPEAWEMPLVG